jgi:hypothetical protein
MFSLSKGNSTEVAVLLVCIKGSGLAEQQQKGARELFLLA